MSCKNGASYNNRDRIQLKEFIWRESRIIEHLRATFILIVKLNNIIDRSRFSFITHRPSPGHMIVWMRAECTRLSPG